jgi:hypothetical protein
MAAAAAMNASDVKAGQLVRINHPNGRVYQRKIDEVRDGKIFTRRGPARRRGPVRWWVPAEFAKYFTLLKDVGT